MLHIKIRIGWCVGALSPAAFYAGTTTGEKLLQFHLPKVQPQFFGKLFKLLLIDLIVCNLQFRQLPIHLMLSRG